MKQNNKKNNRILNLPIQMIESIITENNVKITLDEMADIFTSSIAHIFEIDIAPEGDVAYKIEKKDNQYNVMIIRRWKIVDKIENPDLEIKLDNIKIKGLNLKIKDIFEEPQEIKILLERGSIFKAKTILRQKIISIRNSQIYKIMEPYKEKIINGVIENIEANNHIRVKVLDQFYGYYPYENQIRNEILEEGKVLEFYVEKVDDNAYKNYPLMLSRSSEDFIKELMKEEIPEIEEGSVIIKVVKRLSGIRSKVGVISMDPMIDPIGSCVGNAGSRINSVSQRINGEKIDLFTWHEDENTLIKNAFKPINVLKIIKTKDDRPVYKIIVSTDDILRAIGKKGSNCILVSKLINAPVKILSIVDAINEGYDIQYVDDESKEDTEQKVVDISEGKGTQISSDSYYNYVGDDANNAQKVDLNEPKTTLETNNTQKTIKKPPKVKITKKISAPSNNKVESIDEILSNKKKDKSEISLDNVFEKIVKENKKSFKKTHPKKKAIKEVKQDILSKIVVEDIIDDDYDIDNINYDDDDDDYM